MVHLYEVHQSSTCVTSLNYRCDSLFQIISNAGIALEMYLLQHRSSLSTTHTAMLARVWNYFRVKFLGARQAEVL